MRLFHLSLVLLIVSCCQLYAQQPADAQKKYVAETRFPIIMVDSFVTSMSAMALNPNNIESITVLKGAAAIQKYGNRATDGAVIITMKDGVKLLRMEALFDMFNYPDSARHLPVVIDKNPVGNRELVLVDASYVSGLDQFNHPNWNVATINSQEKYLNIITRKESVVK
jgi:TonB-dependent SusC/RagA subfamily outer membrane receptor